VQESLIASDWIVGIRIVRADEKLTAFLELERAVCITF
jgi:hypothetical protein